jgi:hypothetical protein
LNQKHQGSSANLIWNPDLSTPQHPGAPFSEQECKLRHHMEIMQGHELMVTLIDVSAKSPKEILPPTFRKGCHIQIYTFLSCLIDTQALIWLQDSYNKQGNNVFACFQISRHHWRPDLEDSKANRYKYRTAGGRFCTNLLFNRWVFSGQCGCLCGSWQYKQLDPGLLKAADPTEGKSPQPHSMQKINRNLG